MNNPVKDMLLALKANIEYLKQQGSSQLKIKNGKLLNTIDELYVYEFELDFFQEIDSDTDIEVRVKGESANGTVIAINENCIQIELDKYIGTTIPEAWLVISNYYLLQLLYEKLSMLDKGELKITDLAEKTFNLKPVKTASLDNYDIPYSQSYLPNPSQEKGIKLALGSEVSFIWGPPGTGKTQTIARIIEGFLSMNLSVLMVSHTNVATDGALLHLVNHLKNTDDYLDGKFLREGKIQLPELKKYEMVVPEIVLQKKTIPIENEINSLIKRINEISLIISSSQAIINQFDNLENLRKEEEKVTSEISNKEQEVVTSKNKSKKIEDQLTEIERKVHEFQSKGKIMRFFSGINMEYLIKQKGTLLIQINIETEKIRTHTNYIEIEEGRLRSFVEQRTELENMLKQETLDQHKKTIKQAIDEKNNLAKQKELMSKLLEELANELIKNAKVIATTLTKSYSSIIVLNREYDCVVIDEASMAPLPALWCASGLAKQKVVVVGDFYQLPPIVKHGVLKTTKKSEEEIKKEKALIEKWLKKDIFENNGIPYEIRSGKPPKWLQQLNMQYRMHPDIAKVINELVYGKNGEQFKLDSSPNTNNYGTALLSRPPLENAHIGIYNTHEIGSIAARTDTGSYYNLYHAFLAVELARQADYSGYKNIGIISPFRPQTDLIQKIVKDDENLSTRDIKVDTVHRFQGSEKDLLIFDTTTSRPTKLTDDQEEGGDDEKLLNVDFSRAKEKCLVIADLESIEKKHSNSSLLRKFIWLCKVNGFPIYSSTELLPKYSISKSAEQWLQQIYNINTLTSEIEESKLFTEFDFYKYFIKDLLNAKQEVVIDSPFITTERANSFLPIFEHLIGKGIQIFIFTRQPKEHYSLMRHQATDAIECFESIGITVLPFIGYVHRKLAIIEMVPLRWTGWRQS